MMMHTNTKQQVRDFYNQIGWREVSEGCYQNAAYEDLRPVSREYIHRCHLRVVRHLKSEGRYMLDAGSGPIQYPEYLEYSRSYDYRVCVDISSVALQEARLRIGEHGLFVVADIANLPFKPESFDGVVSLHTIHHLPLEEHTSAYQELYRVLAPRSSAVVVNGWSSSPLISLMKTLISMGERTYRLIRRQPNATNTPETGPQQPQEMGRPTQTSPTGTYVQKHNAAWLERNVGAHMPVRIWTWRSVSVRFLRTFIHERWGGHQLLQVLFWIEEHFSHFLGKYGQYPLIVIRKP